jgi:dolichyl-phosphate beta-glucosyltransferase
VWRGGDDVRTRRWGREQVRELGWSVVLPAYDEEHRLPAYLREVLAYFDALCEPYEVLVVDDGSRGQTRERVRELASAHPAITLHALPGNRGKGCAVRTGMLQAGGALRLMADADGATPIAEVQRLLAAIHAGADLAVGSRARPDPSVVVVARPVRRVFGRVFHMMVRAAGIACVADTQCGFKLLRGHVAEALFPHVTTDGFGFDVELLLRAQRAGYRIGEVPVNWANQPGSKLGVLSHGPRMVLEVLRARRQLAAAGREGLVS